MSDQLGRFAGTPCHQGRTDPWASSTESQQHWPSLSPADNFDQQIINLRLRVRSE
jgi:hypothetical protein